MFYDSLHSTWKNNVQMSNGTLKSRASGFTCHKLCTVNLVLRVSASQATCLAWYFLFLLALGGAATFALPLSWQSCCELKSVFFTQTHTQTPTHTHTHTHTYWQTCVTEWLNDKVDLDRVHHGWAHQSAGNYFSQKYLNALLAANMLILAADMLY